MKQHAMVILVLRSHFILFLILGLRSHFILFLILVLRSHFILFLILVLRSHFILFRAERISMIARQRRASFISVSLIIISQVQQ